jgi:hypothetical protein
VSRCVANLVPQHFRDTPRVAPLYATVVSIVVICAGLRGKRAFWSAGVCDLVCQVGDGDKVYKAARACLQRWGHFQLGWSNVDPSTGVAEGTVLAITSKTLFLWNCNPLRIV